MGKVKDSNFCTIQGWMINDLKLSGSELIAYALIYGFSQAEDQYMTCSQQYIADWCNITRSRCNELLKRMEEKHLIEKIIVSQKGNSKRLKYKAIYKEKQDELENKICSNNTEKNTSSKTEHTPSSKPELAPGSRTEHNKYSVNIDSIYNQSNHSYKEIENLIKKQIDYDVIRFDMPNNIKRIDEIVSIMVDVFTSNAQILRVNKENKPIEIVKSHFAKINMEHIKYVLNSLNNYNNRAHNIKAVIITSLYNSVSTMSNYYNNLYNASGTN